MAGLDSQRGITNPVSYFGGSVRPRAEPSRTPKPRPPRAPETLLALTDPALQVVTDFVWEQPLTVAAERPIDDALQEMMWVGVRALLVVRDEGVVGLITSYDIQGERPLQFLEGSGYRRHDEIEVSHIMTHGSRSRHSIGRRSPGHGLPTWPRSLSGRARPTA